MALWIGVGGGREGALCLAPRTSFDRSFDRLRARSGTGLGREGALCLAPRTSFDRLRARSGTGLGREGEGGFRFLRGFVAVQREVVVAAVRDSPRTNSSTERSSIL